MRAVRFTHMKSRKAGTLVLLSLLFVHAQALGTDQQVAQIGSTPSEILPWTDVIYVDVSLKLPDSYSLLNDDVRHEAYVRITVNFSTPIVNSTYLSSYLYMRPSSTVATSYHQDGSREIQPIVTYLGNRIVLVFPFEAGLKGFDIMIRGRVSGISLIWRNVVDLLGILLQFSNPMPIHYRATIEAPRGAEVTSIISPYMEMLYVEKSAGAESTTYTVTAPISLSIYYRPTYWSTLALALTLFLIFIIIYVTHHIKRIRSMIYKVMILRRIGALISNAQNIMRSGLSSERIFALFMLCSLLMVSLSLSAGPDPRIKIYAVATPDMTSYMETTLRGELGQVQVIGPQDTVTEFETMANIGIIGAYVISYYPSLALPRIVEYCLEPLRQVPLIIVDEMAADAEFLRAVKERYGEKVMSIQGINEITSPKIIWALRRLGRQNPLGIQGQIEFFKAVSWIVGLLSFFEAFLALAFLSSRLIESGRAKGMGALAEAIAWSAFVFFFTQAVYMESSVLLNMPIGLHAVTSGSKEITVVGLLGFGGGSSPRTVAGLLGVLVGAFIAMKSSSEVDRFGFIAVLIIVLLLAIEPFYGGAFFYDFLLFFMSGPRTELMQSSIFYTKDILSGVGNLFGGWVSPMYGLSTGEILFYMGAVPIFLFARLKRSSATMLLLISCFAAGSGFIRTAEMTPYKTVASLIPGLAMGAILMIFFILVSSIEKQLRAKLGK